MSKSIKVAMESVCMCEKEDACMFECACVRESESVGVRVRHRKKEREDRKTNGSRE